MPLLATAGDELLRRAEEPGAVLGRMDQSFESRGVLAASFRKGPGRGKVLFYRDIRSARQHNLAQLAAPYKPGVLFEQG